MDDQVNAQRNGAASAELMQGWMGRRALEPFHSRAAFLSKKRLDSRRERTYQEPAVDRLGYEGRRGWF